MNEDSIFNAALAIDDVEAREAFLSFACGENHELRTKVESLLEAYSTPDSFLDPALSDSDSREMTRRAQPSSPDTHLNVDKYKLLQQIGEGGFGVVYMALQQKPVRREVALKIIKPGMDTKEVIARFEAERQALALMAHPNIAKVLDAGETEKGHPFFVMELVKGVPLTEFCDRNKLSSQDRLELFITICRAVQHAHQKGIIHRDLKPSNVMVTVNDNKPVPKIIDFGVSKAISQQLTERTLFTRYGQMMGTPVYMSPEQAQMTGVDIDTRSDVYSLGILLYELLTGTTPLDTEQLRQTAYAEIQRLIAEEEAPKPSVRLSTPGNHQADVALYRDTDPKSLRQFVNGDLDWIVMKAIDKDRNRRYESASRFAEDIERFLINEEVEARPPSTFYSLSKFARRNRGPVITASALLLTICLGLIGTTLGLLQANKKTKEAERQTNIAMAAQKRTAEERDRAVHAEKSAVEAQSESDRIAKQRRRELYAANMQLANQLWNSRLGHSREVEELLTPWLPVDQQEDLREFAWRHQWKRLHADAAVVVPETTAATVSPHGNLITADRKGIQEWDATTGLADMRWEGDASHARFSTNGRWAAIVGSDDDVTLIDIETGEVNGTVPGDRCVFSSNSAFLATWSVTLANKSGGSHDAQVWRIDNGKLKPVNSLPTSQATREAGFFYRGEQIPQPGEFDPAVMDKYDLQLSADGKSFTLRQLELPNGMRVTAMLDGESTATQIRLPAVASSSIWSFDGKMIASGTVLGHFVLRQIDILDREAVVRTNGKWVSVIAISPDSTKLATAGDDSGSIDLWKLAEPNAAPKLVRTIKAHINKVTSLTFSSDGTKLASHASGVSKLWDLRSEQDGYDLQSIAEDRFGGRLGLEFENTDEGVRIKDVQPQLIDVVSGTVNKGDRVNGLFLDTDGALTEVTGFDAFEVDRLCRGPIATILGLQLEDSDHGKLKTVRFRTGSIGPRSFRLAFDPTGEWLAIADVKLGAISLNLHNKQTRRHEAFGISVAISQNGILAMADHREVVLWDLKSDKPIKKLDAQTRDTASEWWASGGGSLAFSPDGEYLALGTGYTNTWWKQRSDLKVWRVRDFKEIGNPLLLNDYVVSAVAFTPDGSRLVAGDIGGTVRVWRTDSWVSPERTFNLGEEQRVAALVFSPDGRTLTTASHHGNIVQWDFDSGRKLRVLGRQIYALALSPDGRTLASSSKDSRVVLWDTLTGLPLRSFHAHTSPVYGIAFSPDGNTLASVGTDGLLHLWNAPPLSTIDRHLLTLRSMAEHPPPNNGAQ